MLPSESRGFRICMISRGVGVFKAVLWPAQEDLRFKNFPDEVQCPKTLTFQN